MKGFTENTRVQVPAAIQLCRLGYKYLDNIQPDDFDSSTNILTKIFINSFLRLNPKRTEIDAKAELKKLISIAANDDLGREFYKEIIRTSGFRLIDFESPDNNSWHCTTEFACVNPETGDEFRPDITCFVNGLPLAFIEVKIPNNREGILAERARMDRRFSNQAFRSFLNVTQLMIFSNNQEYDNESRVPIQGAFYATNAKKEVFFNVFRERRKIVDLMPPWANRNWTIVEKTILSHRNCIAIRNTPEYKTNLRPDTPTNAIILSLLSKQRFLFLLNYCFAYVEKEVENENGEKVSTLEKHVMRYQQFFATYEIQRKLDEGVKGGIIWHTQGSGKTALAYYNIKALTDWFAKKNIVAKFYFVVDRIDLLDQAVNEFVARGLSVRTAQTREELMSDFRSNAAVENDSGKAEIMVVNIQKFKEDREKVVIDNTYNTHLQRIFFIDEAHRGYDPNGSFLANLLEADKDSIKIALTGTPLLKEERASWKVFGNYIDTYYYDKSIADGYTLKLMREDIETSYKEKIADIFDHLSNEIMVKREDVCKEQIIESEAYLNGLLDYIFYDMRRFRLQHAAPTVAGMIVCETNPQARELYRLFNERNSGYRAALILHDEGDKVERKKLIEEYKKKETIDFLIVNNMLLTGFDAHRLKKLYLCRKLDGHSLLQALTRVNRPFRDFKYGYVVDFANIKENFITTNNRYLEELNRTTLGVDGLENLPSVGESLLVGKEEIIAMLNEVKDILFLYDTTNLENFRKQLDEENDKGKLYELRRKLEDAKALSNQVRSFGDNELKSLFAKLEPGSLPQLAAEVTRRIARINLLEANDGDTNVSLLVNEALAGLEFAFRKKGEEELKIVYNDLRERFQRVREEFEVNFDKKEDRYISLADSFRSYFKKKGFEPKTVADAKESIGYIDHVMERIREINRLNNMLRIKYAGDERFTRIHKRICEANAKRSIPPEKPVISKNEREIAENLMTIKKMVDDQLYWNVNVLQNEPVFNQNLLRTVSDRLYDMKISASIDDRKFIRDKIAVEYLERYYELAG